MKHLDVVLVCVLDKGVRRNTKMYMDILTTPATVKEVKWVSLFQHEYADVLLKPTLAGKFKAKKHGSVALARERLVISDLSLLEQQNVFALLEKCCNDKKVVAGLKAFQ